MERADFLKTIGLGVGGLILPTNSLVKDKPIKIYDNYIKGLSHYDLKKIKSDLKEGTELSLQRDAGNIYDSFAVAVYYQEHKLGYLPAYENIVLANMLDAGVKMRTFISKVNTKEAIYRSVALEVFANLIVPSDKLITLIQTEQRADDSMDIYRTNY